MPLRKPKTPKFEIDPPHLGPVMGRLTGKKIRVKEEALHKIAHELFLELEQIKGSTLNTKLENIRTGQLGSEEKIILELIEELKNPKSPLRHQFEKELKLR